MANQENSDDDANGASSAKAAPAAAQPRSRVAHRVAQHAAKHPTDVALRAGGSSLSYAGLDARANELAGFLRSVGVGREVVVGIVLERSFDRIAAALAAWRAGGAFLPLDPTWPDERLRTLLDDAQAPVVIGPSATVTRLSSAERIPVALDPDTQGFARFGSRVTLEDGAPDDLAYVICTSGSTGEPKGVEITHANLDNLIAWHHDAFGVTPEYRTSHLAGLGFDAAIWEVWPYLAIGACVSLVPRNMTASPVLLRQFLVEERIGIAFVPTPLAEPLMSMDWPADTALKFLLTGADRLHAFPRPDLPFTVVNNYGPTECTVVATSGAVSTRAEAGELPSIGKPIANTQIYLLDEHGNEVAEGWPGEIYIGGAGVGRGYRNRPALTDERFVPDKFSGVAGARLYRTGDLGCTLASGEIAFRGRLDDQEKIRGYRVEPDDVAAALTRHDSVASCAVVARQSAGGEKQLVAYVVPAGDLKPSSEELWAFLGTSLPDYMIPAAFVGLGALPLTSSGKLDKAALPEPTEDNTLDRARFRAPATPTEERLAAIVREVLGTGRIGIDDNFFFLVGGHSPSATQVVIRAREAFDVELTLWHFFEAQTVANLAVIIEKLLVAKLEAMTDEEARRPLGR